jgi:hypothetical protein
MVKVFLINKESRIALNCDFHDVTFGNPAILSTKGFFSKQMVSAILRSVVFRRYLSTVLAFSSTLF